VWRNSMDARGSKWCGELPRVIARWCSVTSLRVPADNYQRRVGMVRQRRIVLVLVLVLYYCMLYFHLMWSEVMIWRDGAGCTT
jgi:hypothetical protein